MIRFGGKDGNPMFLCSVDTTIFGYGVSVAYCLIVPVVLLTYCLGGVPSHVDAVLACVGGVVFSALGGVALIFDQGKK